MPVSNAARNARRTPGDGQGSERREPAGRAGKVTAKWQADAVAALNFAAEAAVPARGRSSSCPVGRARRRTNHPGQVFVAFAGSLRRPGRARS